jgi:DNA-binding NtrC family response regulator
MKHCILAVDDEPANLRMLERLFHKDYRVLSAFGGQEALEILRREEVALIITDQRMPGMTGTELLKASMQTRPDVAKIILTGYTDPEALIEAINTTRVYKFISKPWEPAKLKEIVDEAIREHRKSLAQKQLLKSLVAFVQASPDLFMEDQDGEAELSTESSN